MLRYTPPFVLNGGKPHSEFCNFNKIIQWQSYARQASEALSWAGSPAKRRRCI